MSDPDVPKHRYILWFLFGFLVFFIWIVLNLVVHLPWYLYIASPLIIVLILLWILTPRLRRKETETRTDKINFFAALGGSLLGAVIGIIVKYELFINAFMD